MGKYMTDTIGKRTLKQLHKALVEQSRAIPQSKIAAVIALLDSSSPQTFYDVSSGRRKLNPAEKEAIAKLYNVTVDAIDWKDKEKLIG